MDETALVSAEQDQDVGTAPREAADEILDQIGQHAAFDWSPEPHYLADGNVLVPDEFEDVDGNRDTSALSERARGALMDLDAIITRADVASRRIEVQQAWKANHYDRGYQYLLWKKNQGWILPGQTNFSAEAQQSLANLYHTNVYGEKKEIIVAALSREVPKVEFFPANPDHPPDQDFADVSDDLKDIWAKNNNLGEIVRDVAGIFWNEDRCLLWTRYELNGEEYGYEEPDEPAVPEDELAPPTTPDGTEGGELYDLKNQSVTTPAAPRRPRGRVITSAHGKLDHKVPIYVDCQGRMMGMYLCEDKDESTAKAQFPWMRDKIHGGGDGIPEAELDRIARENVRQAVPGSYVTGDAMNRHTVVKHTWIRRQMFYDASVEAPVRDELLAKFPDGALLVKASSEFCYARNECLDDHCAIGHPFPGKGQNRRAMGESLLPIQDYINEMVMLVIDFAKRTISKKWMDNEAFDVEAIKSQKNVPGTIGPFQRQPGVPVDQLIFVEPTPTPQPFLVSWVQWIITVLSEQISGALPSLFGAQISGQVGSEGVAIQRDQALQRVGCPWNSIQTLFAQAIRQAVMLTAKCSRADISDVIPGKGPVTVKLNSMKGAVLCYPEANPDFPESWAQRESRLTQLLDYALKSPDQAISQIIMDPRNLKQFQDGLRLKGFVIKGADSVKKQEAELEILLRSGPVPNPQKQQIQQAITAATAGMAQTVAAHAAAGAPPDPETAQQLSAAPAMLQQLQQQSQSMPDQISTVPVRADGSEDDVTESSVCFDWMNGPDGRKFSFGTPEQQAAFQNVHLHWTEHQASIAKQAAQKQGQSKPASIAIATDKMPPEVQAQILAMNGIQASPDSFLMQDRLDLNQDVAKKVIPKQVEGERPETHQPPPPPKQS